ncbi:MAG TPA: hypothetical protein VFV37_09480 [Luteibaculaceae bacterium]|nr:hypothetical protein [Luteibaculaceae bacterium]
MDSSIEYFDPPADFPSEMVVDCVLVKKLKSQCNRDVQVYNQSEFTNLDDLLFRSVEINGLGGQLSMAGYSAGVLRAKTITIVGNTEVPLGKEIEFVTHECPM